MLKCSSVGELSRKDPVTDLDLIIIGGGPAGLTAGLYAARANMKAILLDSKDVGGEILNTELIEDYPGFESVTGSELAQKMAEHALKFGLKIETYKPVKEIRSEGDRKIVKLEDGTELSAYAVIVTVGGEPTKLGVVGEKEYHGRGVSYCAVCDGAFFKGADLAVIGGGDSAFQEGLFLTRFANKLYVVHRRNDFRAQAILQDRLLKMDKVEPITPAEVKEIGGNGDVKWIDIEGSVNGSTWKASSCSSASSPWGAISSRNTSTTTRTATSSPTSTCVRASRACTRRATRVPSSPSRSRRR